MMSSERSHVTAETAIARCVPMRVPFDLAASEREAGWRDVLRWPLDPVEGRAASLDLADRLAGFLAALDDHDELDTAVLAAPVVLNGAITLGLAALAVERAMQLGIALAGGPPEVAFLAGAAGGGDIDTPLAAQPPVRPRWPALRHVARTASWTPARLLPRVVLRPDATAVTHNPILRAYARNGRLAVRFWQAERMLDAAGVPAVSTPDDAASDLAARLVSAVVPALALTESSGARLAHLLRNRTAMSLGTAQAALRAFSCWCRLPREVWLGTAGRMPARVIAVAARRRGGRVTSFDHGGGLFLRRTGATATIREFAVVDRVVVATETVAALGRRAQPYRSPAVAREVLAVCGDPTFRRIRTGEPARASRRRVMYLPTPLRGFRQFVPPHLPDVVALDWHMRLARTLSGLPIDLVVRPHPEGALPGAHHPVTKAYTPMIDGPFHWVVGMVDGFTFDYPHSTAFWEALCTDRPVVLIDLGTGDLSDETKAIVARRCRIIDGRFDDRNRPHVDHASLEDAVCGGPSTADPTEVRILLAGDRT